MLKERLGLVLMDTVTVLLVAEPAPPPEYVNDAVLSLVVTPVGGFAPTVIVKVKGQGCVCPRS